MDSGRGTAKAEDAQGTPTQSHISPSILAYKENPLGKHGEIRDRFVVTVPGERICHVCENRIHGPISKGTSGVQVVGGRRGPAGHSR